MKGGVMEVFPKVSEEKVSWGKYSVAKGYKAIVNPDTGLVFSIVSEDYKLIRHETAIEQVNKIISKTPDLGEHEITVEFYGDGARMRMKYRFTDIPIEIEPDDYIFPELQLFNSYDTTWPFIVLVGAFRFVCSNGLVIGEKFLDIRKRHVIDFDKIQLEQQIFSALEKINSQADQWKQWTDRKLTQATYTQIMKTMKFGKKATEEIEQRIQKEAQEVHDNRFPVLTLWIFFNILTWFITHRAVSLNHHVEMGKRLRSAIVHI